MIHKAAAEQTIFNTSATLAEDRFVLAYEVHEPNQVNFSARFLMSSDLEKWGSIEGFLGSGFYAACPTIRFIDGYY